MYEMFAKFIENFFCFFVGGGVGCELRTFGVKFMRSLRNSGIFGCELSANIANV